MHGSAEIKLSPAVPPRHSCKNGGDNLKGGNDILLEISEVNVFNV